MSEELLARMFTTMRSRFLRHARGMLPSLEDAEDALHDVFVRLWTRADSFETPSDVEAVTRTALRNWAIDRNRRQRRAESGVEPSVDPSYEQSDALRQAELLMDKLLTPLQCEIIRLKEYDDRPYSEVAAMLNMTETAVRMQLSRARKKLRTEWNKL